MPPVRNGLRLAVRDAVSRSLWAAGLTHPARAAGELLTVVTLHRVLPERELAEYPLPQLAVTVDELAWMVAFLAERFTCETLSTAHRRWSARERPPRPFLALTFDDGQLDNFVHARPVLERAGVPGTFFVPADAVDSGKLLWHDRLAYAAQRLLAADRAAALRLLEEVGAGGDGAPATAAGAVSRSKRLDDGARSAAVERLERAAGGDARPAWDGIMAWDQLRTLAGAGHEIGSHTISHPLLPGLDDARLEREIAGSRERISSRLGVPCQAFCYPNGDHDPRVVEAVRRAGYERAVVTTAGPNPPGADPFQLSRCELQGRTVRDRGDRLSTHLLALRLSPWFARLRG